MTKPASPRSICCKAPVRTAGSGEGTNWYECTACDKPCMTESPARPEMTILSDEWLAEFKQRDCPAIDIIGKEKLLPAKESNWIGILKTERDAIYAALASPTQRAQNSAAETPFAIQQFVDSVWKLTADGDGWSRVTLEGLTTALVRGLQPVEGEQEAAIFKAARSKLTLLGSSLLKERSFDETDPLDEKLRLWAIEAIEIRELLASHASPVVALESFIRERLLANPVYFNFCDNDKHDLACSCVNEAAAKLLADAPLPLPENGK